MLTITKDNIEKDGTDTNEDKIVAQANNIELTGETKVTGTLTSTGKLKVDSGGLEVKKGIADFYEKVTISGEGLSMGAPIECGQNNIHCGTLNCTTANCGSIKVGTTIAIDEV